MVYWLVLLLSLILIRRAEILLSKGKDTETVVSVSNLGLYTNHSDVCLCSFVITYCLLVGVLCCLYSLEEVGKRLFICTLRRQPYPIFTPIKEGKVMVVQRINKTPADSL
jgi:hypothetical protein